MADPLPEVTLAWDASPSANIAGYRLYTGVSSGQYTNVSDVGAATSITVSNLVIGTTYYFALSAYDIVNLESELSAEVSYIVRPPQVPSPRLQLAITPENKSVLTGTGPAGYTYDILVSSDLQNWLPLASLSMDTNGTGQFTDDTAVTKTAARYYRLQETPRVTPE